MDTASTWLHAGGVVGRDGTRGYVHPSYFDDAPRFHAGLGGDEFAAILQRGERVLTERQQAQVAAAAGNKGAGGPTVFNLSFPNVRGTKQDADSFARSAQQSLQMALDAQTRAKSRNG